MRRPGTHNARSPQEWAEISAEYQANVPVNEIADKHDMSRVSVTKGLRSHGYAVNEAVLMTVSVSRDDALYLAGLFDGEGCVSTGVLVRNPTLRIGITSTCMPVLQWIKEVVGGAISGKGRIGTFGKKPCWQWGATTSHAALILRELQPHMKIKKRLAELGIELADRIALGRGKTARLAPEELAARMALREQIREINSGHRRRAEEPAG